MKPDAHREAALFEVAAKLHAKERSMFLEGACHGDPGLRTRLDALLAAHKQPEGALAESAPTTAATMKLEFADALDEAIGQKIGRYKILEKVGEGGCGVVYVAEQTEPVRRRVALKVIKLGMDTKQVVARFEAERQALAMMDHTNIAKVFDAGTTEAGRPYFVMELVRGIPITEYCDQNQFNTKARLDLFIKVCHAIQHAHQKGIIHRDIKPSNILVTLHDGDPVPKVIDFGIAKATEGRLSDATVYTQLHQFIGTPAYMSPEQAEMSGLDIDTRSDIYSLGVLLYELLVGSTPFDAKELVSQGIEAMRRTIREKEPPRPSTRLASLGADQLTTTAKRRSVDNAKLLHQLKGDLDWIVIKCLEKDRTRRYETANGLAVDLKRHLNHEAVVARPPSTAYRFQKALHRNKMLFIAGTAVTFALVVGLGLATVALRRALTAQESEAEQRRQAQQAQAREAQLRHVAEVQELAERRRAYASDMNLAQQSIAVNNFGRAQELLNRHRPKPGQKDLRGWEWRYLWQQCQSDASFEMPQQFHPLFSAELAPDGKLLVTADIRGSVKFWDFPQHKEIRTLKVLGELRTALAFSPTGKLLALSSAPVETMHFVSILDLESGETIMELPHTNGVQCIAFTPDEKRLVAWESGLRVLVWNLETRRPIFEFAAPSFGGLHQGKLAVSPDGRLLAIGGMGVRGIDLSTGQTKFNISSLSESITAIAFSPDGGLLAVGTGYVDGAIRLFDAATGNPAGQLIGHTAWVSSLRFSRDGKRLISGSADQTVRVWDVTHLKPLLTLTGHSGEVWCVALAPDGQSAVSGGKDGSLLGWDFRRQSREDTFANLPKPLTSAEFSTDNRIFYGVDANGSASVWDCRSLRELRSLMPGETNVTRVLASKDGRFLAVGTTHGEIEILDGATLLSVTNLPGRQVGVVPVAFRAGEKTLVCVDDKSVIDQWDTASWRKLTSASFPGGFTRGLVALSDAPNTGFLLLNPSGRERAEWLSWWKLSDSREEACFQAHTDGAVVQPAVSPDGQLIATAASESIVKLWTAATHTLAGVLRGHLLGVHSVAFSPDGDRLASGSDGREAVKLWDCAIQQDVATLAGRGSLFDFIRFSPDGNLILAINTDGLVHLWRAPSWAEIAAAESKESRHTQ